MISLWVVLAFAINYFKDDDIQDWIERCTFGKLTPYSDLKKEQAQLLVALNSLAGD